MTQREQRVRMRKRIGRGWLRLGRLTSGESQSPIPDSRDNHLAGTEPAAGAEDKQQSTETES